MTPTKTLRKLLAEPGLVMAPGVADAAMAKLVTRAGFNAIYMTGAGTSAVRLGKPDIGLMTLPEMADNAQRIAESSGLPLIADADDGYGGVMNVQRTVQTYERAGVAGIHIEDQQMPKRCGHLAGKSLVPPEEMAAKIRAAVDARKDQDFLLIARTDAIAVEGLDRALERAAVYEEAGADMIFVEAPGTEAELKRIPKALKTPALFNMASSGKTPFLTADEISALGFKLAIYPNFVLLSAITAAAETLAELKEKGSVKGLVNRITTFKEFFEMLGMSEVQKAEARYGVAQNKRAGF